MLVSRRVKFNYTSSSLGKCVRDGLAGAVREHILNGVEVGPTVFARISRSGDRRMVDALLSAGVELDTLFLKTVIIYGYTSLAFYLMEAGGVTPDSSCIDQAAKSGSTELIDYMVARGAEATSFALEKAVQYEKLPVVKQLIGMGVGVESSTLVEACYNGNPEIMSCLLENNPETDIDLLALCIKVGSFQCAEILLSRGYKATSDALIWAVHREDKYWISRLIEEGAQITPEVLWNFGAEDVAELI